MAYCQVNWGRGRQRSISLSLKLGWSQELVTRSDGEKGRLPSGRRESIKLG